MTASSIFVHAYTSAKGDYIVIPRDYPVNGKEQTIYVLLIELKVLY